MVRRCSNVQNLLWVLALFGLPHRSIAGGTPAEDHEALIVCGRGAICSSPSREPDRKSSNSWGGAVYWVSVRGQPLQPVRVSPRNIDIADTAVARNGRMIWVTGGHRAEDPVLRTVSYPDMKTRQHPLALLPSEGGWLSLSPDGRTLAYRVRRQAQERSEGGPHGPKEDRDPRQRSSWAVPSEICFENLESGRTTLTRATWDSPRNPAWAPDCKRFAFHGMRHRDPSESRWGSLHVVEVESGEHRLLAPASTRGWTDMNPELLLEISKKRPTAFLSLCSQDARAYFCTWSLDGRSVFFRARYDADPEGGLIYAVQGGGNQACRPVCRGSLVGLGQDPASIYVIGPPEPHIVRAVTLGERGIGQAVVASLPKRDTAFSMFVAMPTVSSSGRYLAYQDTVRGESCFESPVKVRFLKDAGKEIDLGADFGGNVVLYWVAGAEAPFVP